jgi:hypothetical protein
MRTNVQADQLNWLELLDGAVMAINNAPIADDRPSPFEVETGLAMKLPIDTQPLMGQTWQNRGDAELVRDTMQHDESGSITDVAPYPALYEHYSQQRYEFDHPERMRAIHQMAREQMLQAKLRMQDVENRNRPQRTYEVGDYVMLRLDHMRRRHHLMWRRRHLPTRRLRATARECRARMNGWRLFCSFL